MQGRVRPDGADPVEDNSSRRLSINLVADERFGGSLRIGGA